MAEKTARTIGMGTKPVPMKFFAVLEVEKTAPSCIPRYVPEATEREMCNVILKLYYLASKLFMLTNREMTEGWER